MFLNFLASSGIFSNPVDVVFFIAIGIALALVIILFIVSKVVQKQRDKKYEELERQAKEQELLAQQANDDVEESNNEALEEVAEALAVEEEKAEEVQAVEEEKAEEVQAVEEEKAEEVQAVEEEKVEEVQAVEEEKAEEVQAVEEEKTVEAPAKKTTIKKAPAKKTAPKNEATKTEKKPTTKKAPAKKADPKKEEVATEEKKTPAKKTTTKKTTTKVEAAPTVEENTEPKGRTYSGKYEVYPSGDGYQYRLKASNGEVLVVSEVYTTKDSTLKAIEAVKRNVETGEIRIFKDKKGLYKFKLTSKNYRVIALGSSYSTEKKAISASESFKKFALNSNVVEIETPANQDNIVEALVDTSTVEEKNGGKYLVEKFDGEFSWDLKASNGQILCQAEGYTSKSGVMSSIESFKRNVETGSFKILKDKNDHYHYNLYTASGRLANIGETYNSKQLAESAALSVVSFFKNAEIEEKK